MYKEFIKKIRSAFWITLILGAINLILPIWEFGQTFPDFPYHLAIGSLIGFVLGFGVSILERSMYIRNGSQKGANSHYRTTSIPKYILLCLIGLLLLANSKGEISYGIIIMITAGVYLLFLSIVIFCIRNNKQILIT